MNNLLIKCSTKELAREVSIVIGKSAAEWSITKCYIHKKLYQHFHTRKWFPANPTFTTAEEFLQTLKNKEVVQEEPNMISKAIEAIFENTKEANLVQKHAPVMCLATDSFKNQLIIAANKEAVLEEAKRLEAIANEKS